jgi:hypothetical protein
MYLDENSHEGFGSADIMTDELIKVIFRALVLDNKKAGRD